MKRDFSWATGAGSSSSAAAGAAAPPAEGPAAGAANDMSGMLRRDYWRLEVSIIQRRRKLGMRWRSIESWSPIILPLNWQPGPPFPAESVD